MAQKKITDLQLRDEVTSELSFPCDDGSQSYRTTAEQLEDFILRAGNVGTPEIADSGVTLAKLAAAVQAALIPCGTIVPYAGSSAPTGYVMASGRTIGSASSGATERANADTETLFTLLWTDWANAELAIQDSGGSASTRGASAAADFAANKRLPLPDLRGRIPAGKDNMGGSTASRLTSTTVLGTTLGKAGGSQTHTLTSSEMPAHTHVSVDAGSNVRNVGLFSGSSVTAAPGAANTLCPAGGSTSQANTGSTGSGGAHANVQPTIILNYIVKL